MPDLFGRKRTSQTVAVGGFNTTSTSLVDVTGLTLTIPKREKGWFKCLWVFTSTILSTTAGYAYSLNYDSVDTRQKTMHNWHNDTKWNWTMATYLDQMTGKILKGRLKTFNGAKQVKTTSSSLVVMELK